MTFSEYIKLIGWEQYLLYCKQRKLKPIKDIDVASHDKPCALLDKNFQQQTKTKNA